jgi:ABC-type nitrate/sulfonate/bicarbonate transport system substrate-binding protein
VLAAAPVGPSQVPVLSVGCRLDNHAAPLYAACSYPAEFQRSYGMYLKEVSARQQYDLYDGRQRVLRLRLGGLESDDAVLASLLDGSNQVGFAAAEEVMLAATAGKGTRIIAPLQYRGDMLLVSDSVPARDWAEFAGWIKQQGPPVRVGFVGDEPTALHCLDQALEYEAVSRTRDASDTVALVLLVRAGTWEELAQGLRDGQLDAAALRQPEATFVSRAGGARILTEIDDLPPNRFENRPGTVVAATDSAIRTRGEEIGRFLELMGLATHYSNNHTRSTLAATAKWLGSSPRAESTAMVGVAFSSMPNLAFRDGLWNWYFALKLKGVLPDSLGDFMERDQWLPIPYDSSLVVPALDRAGARFIK